MSRVDRAKIRWLHSHLTSVDKTKGRTRRKTKVYDKIADIFKICEGTVRAVLRNLHEDILNEDASYLGQYDEAFDEVGRLDRIRNGPKKQTKARGVDVESAESVSVHCTISFKRRFPDESHRRRPRDPLWKRLHTMKKNAMDNQVLLRLGHPHIIVELMQHAFLELPALLA